MMFVCSQEFTWVHVHVVYVHVHVHVHVVYSTYMCMCNVGWVGDVDGLIGIIFCIVDMSGVIVIYLH